MNKIFSATVLSGWVLGLHGSLLHSALEHGNFLNINILQGSVATYSRYSGTFNNTFIENLLPSLSVKEF